MKIAILALILGVLILSGCDPSAYRMHASAVVTVAGAHTVAGGAVDAARSAALDAVEDQHPDVGEARTAARRAEAVRWAAAGESLDAIRSALRTWVSAVELALAADDGGGLLEALLPLAARVLVLWDDMAQMLGTLGVEVPTLPPTVRGLVGGL